jgi:hypothetical protein
LKSLRVDITLLLRAMSAGSITAVEPSNILAVSLHLTTIAAGEYNWSCAMKRDANVYVL